MTRAAHPAQGRLTRHDHDGTPLTDLTHCSFWLDETDYQAVVLAALDEGYPPEALLAEIVHGWALAREAAADAGMSPARAERHGTGR